MAPSPFVRPRWARAAIGGGFALGLGAAKELWDIRHGDPSARDFAWDVAGAAAGVTLAYLLDLALHADEAALSPPRPSPAPGPRVGSRPPPG